MVLLPTERDRNAIKDIDSEYILHWIDDVNFDSPLPKDEFDIVAYTERCSNYIKKNHIDGILYSHDFANLVAGVLCERHNIIGPSLESMFLSNHKYYSRRNEPKPIWSDYIDLETGEWGEMEPTFPCYIKPASLMLTLYQYRIDTPQELEEAISLLRKELPPLLKLYKSFFTEYIDQEKYPLSTKNIVVVEQLVEDAEQHCVEGWFDSEGKPHIWAISDQIYYPGEKKSIDFYATPSVLQNDIKEKLKDCALATVKQHGIDRGFWNVEIWRKDNWVTATEVNGRAASVWHNMYYEVFNKSLYKAMLYLCCGEDKKCFEESPKALKKDRVGGQFHVITYGEGKAEDFLDYDFIESATDPIIEIFPSRNTKIRNTRTSGYWLARFHLYGKDIIEICKEADSLRNKMLKQPDLSPMAPKRNNTYREKHLEI